MLKPRVGFLVVTLQLPLPKVVAALRRQPELLGVDSEVIRLRIDYLEGWVPWSGTGFEPARGYTDGTLQTVEGY